MKTMRSIPFVILFSALPLFANAGSPVATGFMDAGPLDGITDVPGVTISHLTKIEGNDIRTGATAIIPTSDPWKHKVAAATVAFNGNGEMTGTHWIQESGYLEEPIVLTDTMDVGRAVDGVVSWDIEHHPEMGISDDVPLPVVAECDDQVLNNIQARAVTAKDVVHLLDGAHGGQFERGNVGAGTGMRAFGYAAGIGSASRVLRAHFGGYTVGVLVNDNTGSSSRELTIAGVPVGRDLAQGHLSVEPHSGMHLHGRMASGSIVIVIATNAPLNSRQLRALALRAGMGMARTGLVSDESSGDLFIAFSTGYVFNASPDPVAPSVPFIEDDGTLDNLYEATVEATESAIYDALFSAHTMSGRNGATITRIPVNEVINILKSHDVQFRNERPRATN